MEKRGFVFSAGKIQSSRNNQRLVLEEAEAQAIGGDLWSKDVHYGTRVGQVDNVRLRGSGGPGSRDCCCIWAESGSEVLSPALSSLMAGGQPLSSPPPRGPCLTISHVGLRLKGNN